MTNRNPPPLPEAQMGPAEKLLDLILNASAHLWHDPSSARRTAVRCAPYASGTNTCSYQRLQVGDGRTEMADERKSALDAALGQIERQFGKGAIMRMGDDARVPVAAISDSVTSVS